MAKESIERTHLIDQGLRVFRSTFGSEAVLVNRGLLGSLTNSAAGSAQRNHTLCDQAASFSDTLPDAIEVQLTTSGLNRRLSILSALIFDSSVDEGMPSNVAAPNGPDTRPLLTINAASMASFF